MNIEWETVCSFRVYGVPKPGGSKRAFYIKKIKRAVVVDACKKTHEWRNAVAGAAIEVFGGPLLDEPLQMDTTFFFQRPKSHYGSGRNADKKKPSAPVFHTKKPDTTKLIRSTEDALTGIIYRDDSIIITQTNRKIYVEKDDRPGALITIKRIRELAGSKS